MTVLHVRADPRGCDVFLRKYTMTGGRKKHCYNHVFSPEILAFVRFGNLSGQSPHCTCSRRGLMRSSTFFPEILMHQQAPQRFNTMGPDLSWNTFRFISCKAFHKK